MTISDYVADLRAATPSNAAELAAPDATELMLAIDTAMRRLTNATVKLIARDRTQLEALSSRSVLRTATGFVDRQRASLENMRVRLIAAGGFIDTGRSGTQALASRLNAAMDARIAAKKNEYARLGAKLDALSPLKVLSRGYAIALDESGAALKDSQQVKIGDKLTVRLESGALGCKVEEIYGQEN